MPLLRITAVLFGLLMLGLSPISASTAAAEGVSDLSYSGAFLDRTAALISAPGDAASAERDRFGLSLVANQEETSGDWKGLKQDTLYFAFTQMAVIGVLYVSPQSISRWSAEDKEKYSFAKWRSNVRDVVWDTDQWWVNYTLHPYWGGAYYVRASERGYGPVPSFWYSFALSAMYEFGAEALFEQPSIQDLIFTPGLGFFVGRYFMSVREGLKDREMNGESLSGTDRAKLFFTDPLGAVNRKINSALGRQASLTVTPAVMRADSPSRAETGNGPVGGQGGELFSGFRLHLTW
jgi:hypothetical protein